MESHSAVESTRATLKTILDYLVPLLPLANSHTVDFIVQDSWTKLVPENIKTEVLHLGAECILNKVRRFDDCHASEFVRASETHVIENCPNFRDVESFNFSDLVTPVKVTEFMTDKKVHEVERMSKVVAQVVRTCGSDLIVDIGTGKGYLTSIIALHHRLQVLGLDNKETNVNGAVRTTKKLERKWRVYENCAQRSIKTGQPIVKVSCANHEEYFEKYRWRSAVIGDLFKSRVEDVSDDTNMESILTEEYPNENKQHVLLTGLHTCGNLAANCLRLFVTNSTTIGSIVNVGCCYHLIEEEFVSDPPWHRAKDCSTNFRIVPGFPMSTYLRNRRFSLGRDARMCGTQNPSKIFQEFEIIEATKPLYYRALLQELLEKTQKPSDLPSGIVGRIAHKCGSFQEYAFKAFKRLGLQIDMNEDQLKSFFERYIDYWEKLKIFFILKTALSSVIESVILLDRLLYLYEKDIHDAFVTRLFDPVTSPRCYAIVASRGGFFHEKAEKSISNELFDETDKFDFGTFKAELYQDPFMSNAETCTRNDS